MKKKKSIKNENVYIFKVALDMKNSPKMYNGKINKKILKQGKAPCRGIAMLSSHTLYNFAEAINESFDFMFDHCFGFFDNFTDMYKSKEYYELFTDIEDVEPTGAESVEKTKISKVFPEKGKKMLFYFDYGDNWQFMVELKNIEKADVKKSYPILASSEGVNPEQYPEF